MSRGYGVVLANSFSYDEVKALLDLHSSVLRGANEHACVVAASPELVKVVQKFRRMRTKYEDARPDK